MFGYRSRTMKDLVDEMVDGARRRRLIDGSYIVTEDEWDALRDLAYVALTLVPDVEVCPACEAISLLPGDGEVLPLGGKMCISCGYSTASSWVAEA